MQLEDGDKHTQDCWEAKQLGESLKKMVNSPTFLTDCATHHIDPNHIKLIQRVFQLGVNEAAEHGESNLEQAWEGKKRIDGMYGDVKLWALKMDKISPSNTQDHRTKALEEAAIAEMEQLKLLYREYDKIAEKEGAQHERDAILGTLAIARHKLDNRLRASREPQFDDKIEDIIDSICERMKKEPKIPKPNKMKPSAVFQNTHINAPSAEHQPVDVCALPIAENYDDLMINIALEMAQGRGNLFRVGQAIKCLSKSPAIS